eukprot:496824-Rhodomonas_salina.1
MAVVVCLCAPALAVVDLHSPSPNFVHLPSPSFFTPSQRHAGRFVKHLDGLGRIGRSSGKRFSRYAYILPLLYFYTPSTCVPVQQKLARKKLSAPARLEDSIVNASLR